MNKPCVLCITMRANSLKKKNKALGNNPEEKMEQLAFVKADWDDLIDEIGEMAARDLIVKSICNEVYGMFPIKLAMALVVCSGSMENTSTSRGQSHLLLVGDTGMAKSRLLLSAAAFAPHSIHTSGVGCSAAGLTAALARVSSVQFNIYYQLLIKEFLNSEINRKAAIGSLKREL